MLTAPTEDINLNLSVLQLVQPSDKDENLETAQFLHFRNNYTFFHKYWVQMSFSSKDTAQNRFFEEMSTIQDNKKMSQSQPFFHNISLIREKRI